MTAAKKAAPKRVRLARRPVRFVKPEFMQHEALELIDLMRSELVKLDELESPDMIGNEMALASACDELVRAVAEFNRTA